MDESQRIANPFPGLRPFETDEYLLFFGREGQSDELLARLERTRFLAVIGSSGSGKSSLVRAGLLPAMRGGLMAGAGSGWRIAIMRPGHDPVGNLARSLAEKGVLPEAGGGLDGAEAEAVIEATLRRGSLGLVDAVRLARLSSHGNLLVVVDQFEELFRFRAARADTDTGDDAAAFVKLLLEASRQRELPIYIVLTMRSDFLGDCAQFQGLPEAINDGQYLIPRMTRDERRVAITGPVAVARGRLAEPLVSRLLNDVGDNPDQLPILQHALMRTWDFWKQNRLDGEPIGVGHYEAIGTMSEALSRHADEAWGELDGRQQKIAEQMFKALTEKGADNREIRRPARLAEICAVVGASLEEVVAVIEVFRHEGRSFLMPPAGVRLDADTIIDISHESLIRNWVRLRQWVDEEAESARMYRRLVYAAESGSYISGAFLDAALDWRDQHRPTVAWADRYHAGIGLSITFEQVSSFLDASRAHRDALVAEEEKRRQEEIERKRRELEQAQADAKQQKRVKKRLAVILLVALVATAFALMAWVSAKQAKAKVDKIQKAGQGYRDAIASLRAGKLREARQRLLSLVDDFKALPDISGAAACYMSVGDTYFDTSLPEAEIDPKKGKEYYEKAYELNKQNNDLSKAALLQLMGNTLINAAPVVFDEGGVADARELLTRGQQWLEEAQKLYQGKKEHQGEELAVLNKLGESFSDERYSDNPKESYKKALEYYELTLDIYKERSNSPDLKQGALAKYDATALRMADIAEKKLGDSSKANQYRERAVKVSGEIGGREAEADMRLQIARSFGPGPEQDKQQNMAVDLFKAQPEGQATILKRIAEERLWPYFKVKPGVSFLNVRESPDIHSKVVERLTPSDFAIFLAENGKWRKVRVKDKEGFISSDYAEKASNDVSLTSALGYYQKALNIYQTGKEYDDLLKEIGDKAGEILLKDADKYKDGRRWPLARDSYEKAVSLLENNPTLKQVDTAGTLLARAYMGLGQTREGLNQAADALEAYKQARTILQRRNAEMPDWLETKINELEEQFQDETSPANDPQP